MAPLECRISVPSGPCANISPLKWQRLAGAEDFIRRFMRCQCLSSRRFEYQSKKGKLNSFILVLNILFIANWRNFRNFEIKRVFMLSFKVVFFLQIPTILVLIGTRLTTILFDGKRWFGCNWKNFPWNPKNAFEFPVLYVSVDVGFAIINLRYS